MGFLLGKTQQSDRTPSDIKGLRSGASNYLTQQLDFLRGGGPSEFFIENFLGPIRDMFGRSRSSALTQAKESSGNLTGSGLAENLGGVVNRSLADEEGLLAQMLMQERGNILQAILGFGTAGVAPPETTYTPGLLEYAAQGFGQSAPFFASKSAPMETTPNLPPVPTSGMTPLGQPGGTIWRYPPSIQYGGG